MTDFYKNISTSLYRLILIASFTFGAAVHAGDMTDEQLKAHIASQNMKFMAGYANADAAAVALIYATDAVLMPDNAPTVKGRTDIEAAMAASFTGPQISLTLNSWSIERKGNTAYELGDWVIEIKPEGAEPMMDNGDYVVVWQRQENGEWLMQVDIYNSNNLPSH